MTSDRPPATLGRRTLHLLQYVVALTAAVTVVLAALSFAIGAGWYGVKYGLFVVGFLYFGYASFLLQPIKPWKEGKRWRDEKTPSPFAARVERAPPAAWYPIPAEAQFGGGVKLFVASLSMLALSFVMETVFGVVA